MNYCKRPCDQCPFRRDVEPGQFPPERYAALRATAPGPHGESADMHAPMFACHKSADGREAACAGWLAVCGIDHIGVRLALAQGLLPREAITPSDDWPELFESYDEMAKTQSHQPKKTRRRKANA